MDALALHSDILDGYKDYIESFIYSHQIEAVRLAGSQSTEGQIPL